MRRAWRVIRRVWIIAGATAGAIFIIWSLLAYRASGEARRAIESDAEVRVARGQAHWTFTRVPEPAADAAGLVFFPGALVDPVAYAPLARSVAAAGFPVLLVEVPWRGAFGAGDASAVHGRARNAMREQPRTRRWVVAGHSRGAGFAARMLQSDPRDIAALVLIASSHPREYSIAQTPVAVTKVFGTHDGIADVATIESTRQNVPPSTRWIRIDGGNHSQFGAYGFQPFDGRATISREEQQAQTVRAVLDALRAATNAP